ncbi:MAG: sigma-70 family RNA polymerase sigma factor [Thermoleophilaceae bacterium]
MMRRRARAGIDTDKLALLERFGAQMLATARRYSANVHDAEDAYQRATEILLTHDPTGTDEEVCRWLRTTVKHEALDIRSRQERVLLAGEAERVPVTAVNPADTQERAERFERLRQGARALQRLKPQEVRCLLLRAEGYSYREICEVTGFTYTKVNRSLTEGRRAFVERLAGIESGAECDRLASLLSAVADGEARSGELAALRPHLRACPGCRAQLREYRAAPSQVAALVPPAILASSAPLGSPLRGLVESTVGALQDRAAAVGERAHQTLELASGQKIAAVAASAAAVAGGGMGGERIEGSGGARPIQRAHVRPTHERRERAVALPTRPAEEPQVTRPPVVPRDRPAPTPALPLQRPPVQPPPAPIPRPADEFGPAASPAARPSTAGPPSPPARQPAPAATCVQGGESSP